MKPWIQEGKHPLSYFEFILTRWWLQIEFSRKQLLAWGGEHQKVYWGVTSIKKERGGSGTGYKSWQVAMTDDTAVSPGSSRTKTVLRKARVPTSSRNG